MPLRVLPRKCVDHRLFLGEAVSKEMRWLARQAYGRRSMGDRRLQRRSKMGRRPQEDGGPTPPLS